MHSEARFRLASPDIVHDVIDDQVVVVRLDTGVYYSLVGVAGFVWTWLGRGATVQQMREVLGERFPGSDIDSGLNDFVDQLGAEGLIASVDDASGVGEEEVAGALARAALPDPYTAPRFEKYTDMQEVLLIDPIHETDERGWPNPGRERTSG